MNFYLGWATHSAPLRYRETIWTGIWSIQWHVVASWCASQCFILVLSILDKSASNSPSPKPRRIWSASAEPGSTRRNRSARDRRRFLRLRYTHSLIIGRVLKSNSYIFFLYWWVWLCVMWSWRLDSSPFISTYRTNSLEVIKACPKILIRILSCNLALSFWSSLVNYAG